MLDSGVTKIAFYTDGNNNYINAGNVGIGTDDPDEKLDVYGNIKLGTTANSNILNRSNSHWVQYNGGSTTNNTYIRVASVNAASISKTISFYTDASERLTIDSDGNVGINETNPETKLDISGDHVGSIGLLRLNSSASNISAQTYYINDAYQAATYASTSNEFIIWGRSGDITFNTTTTNQARMRITSGGDLLVGATALSDVGSLTQSHLLEGNSETAGTGAVGVYNNSGTANCPSLVVLNRDTSTDSSNRFIQFYANVIGGTNTPMGGIVGNGASNVQFASLSDIREKENVKTINGSLDKISKLNPVEFDWKKSGEHINAGFIAQEVENIFPEYVVENISNEDEEERKGLTGGMTSGIVAHLVKSIQELKAEVDKLKQECKCK